MPAPCNFINRNTTLAICHPERSLAKSEAIRQTKSKDPYQVGTTLGDATNFRVAIGFFDNHERPGTYPSLAAKRRQVKARHGSAGHAPREGMSPVGASRAHPLR